MSTLLKIASLAKANQLTKLIITEPIRNTNHFNKENFIKKYFVNEVSDHILTLTKNNNYKKHIIYLHGGSYTDEALLIHKIFIEKLLKYDFKVSFIDYPLTPEHDYKDIQEFTLNAINKLKQYYNNDIFYLIGDSAGGGLALSMLQKNLNISASVLLSPWVDVSMENPDIKYQLEKDFTLNLDSIIECGKKYAGELETTNSIVSPIYGDLNNLGNLLIYASDNELLYPDILKLNNLINNSINSQAILIVGNNLCHDYPLLIIKETRGIIDEIIIFLNKN